MTPRKLDDVPPETLRDRSATRDLRGDVEPILDRVRTKGDEAVRDLTERFDGVRPDELEVPQDRLDEAVERIDPELRDTLERVRDRIRAVQEALVPQERTVETAPGVTVEIRPRPLDRVGAYAPGGRAAYPSTVLMTVVPARVAGVGTVCLASPPGPTGEIPVAVRAAAGIAGADRVFRMGGVQAVAALAFGTETVPRADKVVGPGNAYVAEAKAALPAHVGVDLPAGPTDLVVVADGTADPDWVASDLAAQAEHDPQAQSVLVALDGDLARAVADRIDDPTGEVHVLVAGDADRAAAWVDAYAPEHLQIVAEHPERFEEVACGSAFVGPWASSVLGDYATGADHVLPTGGAARWRGALSVRDFLADRTVQRIDEDGWDAVAPDAARLAEAEGLDRHLGAVEAREVGR